MRSRLMLLGPLVVLALAGCAGAGAAEATPTPTPTPKSPLLLAANQCGVSFAALSDEDTTLFLDSKGKKYGSGDLQYEAVECVLDELDAPQSVILKMGQTRALDGRQSEDWDNITATWSYHPDNGLDVILELDH